MSESTHRLIRRAAGYLLLWLIVPIGAQIGVAIFGALHPGASAAPDEAPPSLLYGVVGLTVAVLLVLLLSWRLKVGLAWFGVALIASALVAALSPIVPLGLLVVLLLVVPPVVAALVVTRFSRS